MASSSQSQEMEDIDKAISTLQGLSRCTDPDQLQKLIREFEELARCTPKESLNSEGLPSIYQLNEETKALEQKVEKERNRGIFSEGTALDMFEDQRGLILPTSKLSGETTAIRNMEKIYDSIIGDVKKIGVYGMGGIGKTTVMKHINNRFLEKWNDKFDHVIWVTVSKESSVFKLQDDIGRNLKVDLSNYEDTTTRAGVLFKAFQQNERYLLILDDLWEGYTLEHVGIPEPDSTNGCKLALTTRSLDVCRSMKCEAIPMDLLSIDEAWNLFLDHIGHDVLCVKDLEPIVRDVASECARLPLAIVTIATSMRGEKEAYEWRVALAKLRAFSKEPGDKGRTIIKQLKFSYDRLKNPKVQKCLLLCALYPEDKQIRMSELAELLALEGIIEENECMRDEIDEGNEIVNNLIKQCLLEGGKTFGVPWVKMHDMVRDMALQIDDLHSQYSAVSGTELRKLGHVKWCKGLLKIHLSNCHSLNVSPMCPRLTTFILRDHSLEDIPNSFFQHFKALKFLNLSGCISLTVLPDSISDLVTLVGLLLRDCSMLRYVPSLARLKDLQTLDISLSIEKEGLFEETMDSIKLPEGMEELSNLKYLNLMFIPKDVFPPWIMQRLSNLQYLVCGPFTKVSARELMGLKNLEIFKGGFHDIHDLRDYVKHTEQNRSQLTSYAYLVVNSMPDSFFITGAYGINSVDKVVRLQNCNFGKPVAQNDEYLLPKDVQMLEIEDVSNLTSLCALASLNSATDLRICKIRQCSELRELVSTSSSFILQSLERLELAYLDNLEALIGTMQKPCNAFSCLRELTIENCQWMKVVFNIGLLSNLNNLEVLEVSWCNDLEEIIEGPLDDEKDVNEGMVEIILPKLCHLVLYFLPHLRSICPGSRLICESLRDIRIKRCPDLEQCVYAPWDERSPSASLQPIDLKLYDNPRPPKMHSNVPIELLLF